MQGKQGRICEIVLMYIESERVKVNKVERSLEDTKKYIEKYIDEK